MPDISFEKATTREELSPCFLEFLNKLTEEDIKIPGSKWGVDLLKKYNDCLPIDFSLSLTPNKRGTVKMGKQIKLAWKTSLEFVGPAATLFRTRSLKSYHKDLYLNKYHEAFSRTLIDPLIFALSSQHKLVPRFDEALTVAGFPTSRPDCVIYTQSREILGCIEAKAVGHITHNAIVQCFLQLFSLHTKARGLLFGIVTDGLILSSFFSRKMELCIWNQNPKQTRLIPPRINLIPDH